MTTGLVAAKSSILAPKGIPLESPALILAVFPVVFRTVQRALPRANFDPLRVEVILERVPGHVYSAVLHGRTY